MALFTTMPDTTGGGTEVNGGSYSRVAVNFTVPVNGFLYNNTPITFPTATADWGEVVAVGLFTSLTGGNLLYFGPLADPIDVFSGEPVYFPSGNFSITEDESLWESGPGTTRVVVETFANLRQAVTGEAEVIEILGLTSFHDGGEGVFNRRPKGSYTDDGRDVAVAGIWAYVRSKYPGAISLIQPGHAEIHPTGVQALSYRSDTQGKLFFPRSPVSPAQFGGDPTGSADSTAAVQAAIDSFGTGDVDLVWDGTYKISSPLVLTSVKSLSIVGLDAHGVGWRTSPYKSRCWCNEISGTTFDFSASWATLGSVSISGMDFDGANGQALTIPNCSATWTGLLPEPGTGINTSAISVRHCRIAGSRVPLAKAIMLKNSVFTSVEHTEIVAFYQGWGIIYWGSGTTSSTATLRKTFIHMTQEPLYLAPNSPNLCPTDCVFESSPVAITAASGNLSLYGCHLENIGAGWFDSGLGINVTSGITSQGGFTSGSFPATNTMIQLINGSCTLINCVLAYVSVNCVAVVRPVGVTSDDGMVSGGYLKIDQCQSGYGTTIPLIASDAGARRGSFIVDVNDAPRRDGGKPSGAIQSVAQARLADRGRSLIQLSDDTWSEVIMDKGTIVYDGVFTKSPTLYPKASTNNVGDRALILTPSEGGYTEYVNVFAGQPGVWCPSGRVRSASYDVGTLAWLVEVVQEIIGVSNVSGLWDGSSLVVDGGGLVTSFGALVGSAMTNLNANRFKTATHNGKLGTTYGDTLNEAKSLRWAGSDTIVAYLAVALGCSPSGAQTYEELCGGVGGSDGGAMVRDVALGSWVLTGGGTGWTHYLDGAPSNVIPSTGLHVFVSTNGSSDATGINILGTTSGTQTWEGSAFAFLAIKNTVPTIQQIVELTSAFAARYPIEP